MPKEKRESKTYTLRFAKQNQETFDFIKNGTKTVETRAATVKYQSIQKGDTLIMSCGGKKLKKMVVKVTHFKNIEALLRSYDSQLINPGVMSKAEMIHMYHSYPGYQEKIKEFGLLAFELEE